MVTTPTWRQVGYWSTLDVLTSRGCVRNSSFKMTRVNNLSKASLIHFSSKSARLRVRSDKNSDEVEHVSLQRLVETRCRSLFSPFKPVWWLRRYVRMLSAHSMIPKQRVIIAVMFNCGGVSQVGFQGPVKCGITGEFTMKLKTCDSSDLGHSDNLSASLMAVRCKS